MSVKDLRIGFMGDSLLLGTNDDQYLGWPGRLCQRERAAGHNVSLYNMGIRGNTSEQIEARWRAECEARLPDTSPAALVFSFGVNDTADMESVGRRVDLEQSKTIARDMMAAARAWLPTLWVGPPPVDETNQPFRAAPTIVYHFWTERIAEIDAAYAEIAGELDIPYLSLFQILSADTDWPGMYAKDDGVHPRADGYEVMTDHIQTWPAWRGWFDGA